MTRAEQLARAVLDGLARDEDVKELARLVLGPTRDEQNDAYNAICQEADRWVGDQKRAAPRGMYAEPGAAIVAMFAYVAGAERRGRIKEDGGSCNG